MSIKGSKQSEIITLDSKYKNIEGKVYLNGTQALVRLLLTQNRRDKKAGLKTAGFVSGYRGSPLAGLDMELEKANQYLEENKIEFIPAINEDLGATAVWGSQQLHLFPGAKYDGVFGLWYGKGPGVDRSLDALKHANFNGTSPNGGVLALAGDDHICESSTLPHQSEHALISAAIPVLNPSGLQEFLDFGLYGWALSRYSGCWVGLKAITEAVNSSGSVDASIDKININIPTGFNLPKAGLHIRWPDSPNAQEERHFHYKLEAVKAFVRSNSLDRFITNPKKPKKGIITTGKSYLDVLQAIADLGLTIADIEKYGITLYKVGLTWPLEASNILKFAKDLETILVVEEKRSVIETQLKEILYNAFSKKSPQIIGKNDENGNRLFLEIGELSPTHIAEVIGEKILSHINSDKLKTYIKSAKDHLHKTKNYHPPIIRTPYYCSGCPHNTSTVVPEGSIALGGIGCHIMAAWMMPERNTMTFTQMGGEGVPWIGMFPFTTNNHMFVNLGDGTYFHSGILAIRASVAGGVNITYKILYNDAVAMTGGQSVEGPLDVQTISKQVRSEGVQKIAVISDDIEKYSPQSGFASNVDFYDRSKLNQVQSELKKQAGVSVIIYDQTCAAEKRRRRKRGLMEDPAKRVYINDLVCEGCGDCSVKSNCISVMPIETEYGRKRYIDQSSCNKDYSCLKGFCPSFVTVYGGQIKKTKTTAVIDSSTLSQPEYSDIDQTYNILITGIGGTGVITIGALIAMAAHLEEKGGSTLDMTGLAQKGGAVMSHVKIADSMDDIHAVRLADNSADLIISCDLMVTASHEAIIKMSKNRTKIISNTKQTITGEFTKNADYEIPEDELIKSVENIVNKKTIQFVDATAIATNLFGNSIAANLFLLGYAYQLGLIPLKDESILSAIELNNVSIEMNKQAFLWGRYIAQYPDKKNTILSQDEKLDHHKVSIKIEDIISRRYDFLTNYQNEAYAERYKRFVYEIRDIEKSLFKTKTILTETVAKYLFKLMAYKDEYEVARLYTDDGFIKGLQNQFEGSVKLNFHLAPPLFSKKDPETKELQKRQYGAWIWSLYKILSKLKFLRGSPFDIFGYTKERKMERQLIVDYKELILSIASDLTKENYDLITSIAQYPEYIRGFGHVKERHLNEALKKRDELLSKLKSTKSEMKQATAA